MKLEINEEEREFLLRICTRAKIFASQKFAVMQNPNDLEKIQE